MVAVMADCVAPRNVSLPFIPFFDSLSLFLIFLFYFIFFLSIFCCFLHSSNHLTENGQQVGREEERCWGEGGGNRWETVFHGQVEIN